MRPRPKGPEAEARGYEAEAEAEAEAKILASRPVWPRGFNISEWAQWAQLFLIYGSGFDAGVLTNPYAYMLYVTRTVARGRHRLYTQTHVQ